jgi:uncharacterized membrane protein YgcG
MRKLAMLTMVFAIGCGGEQRFDPSSWRGGMTGRMEVRLVDAPATDVNEIWVTILHVDAHVAGAGWKTIASQRATVDLLKLQNGMFALLGVTQLPAGKLSQIRLYVDEAGPNYVVTPDGKQHPLKAPSGPESGIKLKLGLDLPACATGNITLDFDGKKSIFTHPKGAGAGDQWILRPVVRLKAVTAVGNCPPGSVPPGAGTPPGSTPPGTDPPMAPNPDSPGGSTGGGSTGGGSTGGGTGGGTVGGGDSSGGSTGGGTGGGGDSGGTSGGDSGGSGSGVPGTVATFPGAPVDCNGAICGAAEICYNGVCIGDDIFMY